MPDLALEIRAARNSDLEEILRLLARDSFTVQAEDENGWSHYQRLGFTPSHVGMKLYL